MSAALYGCPSWILYKCTVQSLIVFERCCLRSMFKVGRRVIDGELEDWKDYIQRWTHHSVQVFRRGGGRSIAARCLDRHFGFCARLSEAPLHRPHVWIRSLLAFRSQQFWVQIQSLASSGKRWKHSHIGGPFKSWESLLVMIYGVDWQIMLSNNGWPKGDFKRNQFVMNALKLLKLDKPEELLPPKVILQLSNIDQSKAIFPRKDTKRDKKTVTIPLEVAVREDKECAFVAFGDNEALMEQLNLKKSLGNANFTSRLLRLQIFIAKLWKQNKIAFSTLLDWFQYIPREHNSEADRLVNIAMNERASSLCSLSLSDLGCSPRALRGFWDGGSRGYGGRTDGNSIALSSCAWVLEAWVKPRGKSCWQWMRISHGSIFFLASVSAYEAELCGAEFLLLALGHFWGVCIDNLRHRQFFIDNLNVL